MVLANSASDDRASVDSNVGRFLRGLDRPASARFVWLVIGCAWLFWFTLWRANYADFVQLCNHDSGAALRTDEIVAAGLRPAIDFFYYYGPLPIVLSKAFFALTQRSPAALLALLALVGALFAGGLARVLAAFHPSRLGVALVALATTHVITPAVPTHALEAAVLVWAVSCRIRGERALALGLAACAIFVKISMGTVLLVCFGALAVLDAVRERKARPLASLLAVPCSLTVPFVLCSSVLGSASVLASFDPSSGAKVYRACNLGFLHEGRFFWYPAGHTLGWYLGGLPGPWIVASSVLLVLGVRGGLRLLRAAYDGTPRDAALVAEETHALMAVANLAFVVVFFSPSAGVNYYAWVPLVGTIPLLARARWHEPRQGGAFPGRYGWLVLAVLLSFSTKATIAQFVGFARQQRVAVGAVTLPAEQADELKQVLARGHATGSGAVAVVARAANFGLVDPKLLQGRYWMMLVGMRTTPSVPKLVDLARSADAILVTQTDYLPLTDIPEFHRLLLESQRLHVGKYFLLLRPGQALAANTLPVDAHATQ